MAHHKGLLSTARSRGLAESMACGLCVCLGLGLFLAAPRARAYEVRGGDVLLRPVVGSSAHILHLDVATRATPAAGMVIGLDAEFPADASFSMVGGIRPFLGPRFVDVATWLGGRVRYTELRAPLLPWLSGGAVVSLGGPLGHGEPHGQIGARAAMGVDYFVIRDVAFGLEVGTELAWLWSPLPTLEWSTDVLVGMSWRL